MIEGSTRLPMAGTPASLNALGSSPSGAGAGKFAREKRRLQSLITTYLLAASSMREWHAGDRLPRRLETVRASAQIEFITTRRRDEGNYRAALEKALGDALVGDPNVWPEGRWLTDDTPDRFTFGRCVIESGATQGRMLIVLEWKANA